jgi:hypothetical protein
MTKYNIPTNTLILGPWSGKLDNSGDTIELERPDNPNVTDHGNDRALLRRGESRVRRYPPWPASADGAGHSLQRIEPTLFANDPLNWQAGAPTAGQLNPIGPMVDIDGDGLPDAWELANAFDPQFNGGTDNASGDGDNDGANNFHEYVAGTNPHDSQRLPALLTNASGE